MVQSLHLGHFRSLKFSGGSVAISLKWRNGKNSSCIVNMHHGQRHVFSQVPQREDRTELSPMVVTCLCHPVLDKICSLLMQKGGNTQKPCAKGISSQKTCFEQSVVSVFIGSLIGTPKRKIFARTPFATVCYADLDQTQELQGSSCLGIRN